MNRPTRIEQLLQAPHQMQLLAVVVVGDDPPLRLTEPMLDALDYRSPGQPTVVHVDQEWNYQIMILAPDLETFWQASSTNPSTTGTTDRGIRTCSSAMDVRCATITDAFGCAEEITTTKALVTVPDCSVLTDDRRATTTATDRSAATQARPGELAGNRIADDIVAEVHGLRVFGREGAICE